MTQPNGDLNGVEERSFTSVDDLVWLAENAPDTALDEFGNRPLHYAAKYGSLDAIAQIMALGANPTLPNSVGQKASDVARRTGHIEVALALRGYERNAELDGKSQLASNQKIENNLGAFSPTPTTNLLHTDTDWELPENFSEEIFIDNVINDYNHINKEVDFISKEVSSTANVMLWCFYCRVKDLFKNIDPLIAELHRAGLSLLNKNYEGIFHNYYYPFWKIQNLIELEKSTGLELSDALQEIFNVCESQIADEDRVEGLINSIQQDSSQISAHMINIIRIMSCFTDMFDGDLFENRESGDQDLLNPSIKLVPPIFEAAEKFEKECEQFLNDWGQNFAAKTNWDSQHWIVPD